MIIISSIISRLMNSAQFCAQMLLQQKNEEKGNFTLSMHLYV